MNPTAFLEEIRIHIFFMRSFKENGGKKDTLYQGLLCASHTVPWHLQLIDCPLPGMVGSLAFYNGQGGLDLM